MKKIESKKSRDTVPLIERFSYIVQYQYRIEHTSVNFQIFRDKQLICCESAMKDFENIINTLGELLRKTLGFLPAPSLERGGSETLISAVLWIRHHIFFGSGSYFDLDFGSGFGSGLFMKNTFELQMIETSQKSIFLNLYIFGSGLLKISFELHII
jgi:hypothetical protein